MMCQNLAWLAVLDLLLLARLSSGMAVPHVLDPRAPHFAEVMVPEPDYVLRANGSSNDTVAFQYRNGERAYDTTMTVSLVNGNETYVLASNVSFYNSWYVNATLTVIYDQIPDGNYTLLAAEILDGDIYSEIAQPFGISHDPNSPPPTGSMSDIDLSAPASTSAYIVLPGGVTSYYPSSSFSNPYEESSQQTSAPDAPVAAAATASSSAGADDADSVDASIEDGLRQLAEAINVA